VTVAEGGVVGEAEAAPVDGADEDVKMDEADDEAEASPPPSPLPRASR
jgi:hypothetical protein